MILGWIYLQDSSQGGIVDHPSFLGVIDEPWFGGGGGGGEIARMGSFHCEFLRESYRRRMVASLVAEVGLQE